MGRKPWSMSFQHVMQPLFAALPMRGVRQTDVDKRPDETTKEEIDLSGVTIVKKHHAPWRSVRTRYLYFG